MYFDDDRPQIIDDDDLVSTLRCRLILFFCIQLLVAIVLLIGSLPFLLDPYTEFAHELIRLVLLFLLLITVIWFVGTFLAILYVCQDDDKAIRKHLWFNGVITSVYIAKLVILIVAGDVVTSIFCGLVNILNFVTFYSEIKFLSIYV